MEAGPLEGFDCHLIGTNRYEGIADSHLVVLSAGLTRKPDMSREALLHTNADIVKSVAEQIAKYARDAFVLVVSNPLDVMAYVAKQVTGFPKHRVIGMAGVLDSTRFRTFIAQELQVSIEDVQAFVLGGHGDAMVPLPRYATVSGIPIAELLSPGRIERLIERTRKGGEGEYGLKDLYCGVPVKLGASGVKQTIEVRLTLEEQAALMQSAKEVEKAMQVLHL